MPQIHGENERCRIHITDQSTQMQSAYDSARGVAKSAGTNEGLSFDPFCVIVSSLTIRGGLIGLRSYVVCSSERHQ